MATTYTPTAKNEAFATARAFRVSLGNAVRAGFDAGAVTVAALAEATGQSVGEVNRILSATSLALEDTAHITAGFDAAGFAAYHAAVSEALGAMGPEGWDV